MTQNKNTIAPPNASAAEVQFMEDVTSGRIEMPVIPRVVMKLIAALREPDVNLHEIVDDLSQDPMLSAKVLRLANSSYFGGRGSLSSIDSAVSTIGTQALTTIVLTCGLSSAFVAVPGVDLKQFWTDALVCATAANRLAKQFNADPDSAYLCGLVHATGHLMLCQAYPEQARSNFADAPLLDRVEMAERERAAFGISHPMVGGVWADRLGFPAEVGQAVRLAVDKETDADPALVLVLRSACELASAIARGDDAEAALGHLSETVQAHFSAVGHSLPNAELLQLYSILQRVEPML
ncbi:MAG: HDOD domain-containing protein [Janthinobacterium lividum]